MTTPLGMRVGIGMGATFMSSTLGYAVTRETGDTPAERAPSINVISGAQAAVGAGLALFGGRGSTLRPIGLGLLASVPVTRNVASQPDQPHPHELPAPDHEFTRDEVVDTTQSIVDQSRAMFSSLGFSSADGNSPNGPKLEYDPTMVNAYFNPGGSPEQDRIVIGATTTGLPFSEADDVVAHEYAHRIINHYDKDSRGVGAAIVESLADTFAVAIDRDNWLVGEGIFDGGLRNMETGEGSMNFIHRLLGDGAHTRLAAPNRAAAAIGTELGRDAMAQLYADVLRHMPQHGTTMDSFEALVVERAQARWGAGSSEATLVLKAWASAREHE